MIRAASEVREWFVGELSSLVPSWFGALFLGVPIAKRLRFSEEAKSLAEVGGEFLAPMGCLGQTHSALGIVRPAIVDAALPVAFFLRRTIEAPDAASGAFHKAAELDLIRRTPFRPPDVYWRLGRPSRQNGRLSATQWVARRSDINELRERLQTAGLTLRRVSIERNPDVGVIADLSATIAGAQRSWRMLNGTLALTALVFAAILWLAPAWRAGVELAQISEQLPKLRDEAVQRRAEVETLRARDTERGAFLDQIIFRPKLVDLLHDMTVALPDTTWLGELSFSPGGANIAGETSGSAVALVLALSDMEGFRDPHLTGAVSRATQGVERFEIGIALGTAP